MRQAVARQAVARALGLLALGAVALAGCTSQVGTARDRMPEGFRPWEPTVDEYLLRPGDHIEVKLIHNPELSDRLIIGPDGRFVLPLVGLVQAEGRTPGDVAGELVDRYGRELREPEVAVIVREFASQRVLVGGEVVSPGIHSMPGRIGVLEGIMLAGGFRETAGLQQVAVIRRGPDHRPMLRVVDVRAMLTGGDLAEDVPLQPFDVIYVPRSSIAELNMWIDQYVTRLLPFNRSFSYTLNRELGASQ